MAKGRRIMPYMMYERITECVNESNLSASEIGKQIDRDRKCVYAYMNGASSPDSVTLMKMCILFGVSADWMLGLKKERT